jgi:hypothetical protein
MMPLALLAAPALLSALAAAPDLGADLRRAAAQGRVSQIDDLLARGAPVDAADARDWTALHHAVIARQSDAARLLLDRGADPNFRGQFDLTPLHWAAMRAYPEICALLMRRGARHDASSLWGMQPLHLAGDAKVVEVLLEAGASLTAVDETGATPLHRARNGRVARAILKQQAADIRLTDRAGRTPLEIVIYDDEAVRGLVMSGTRKAARLRTASGSTEVEVVNVSEEPILDFAVKAEDTPASTAVVRPERLAELAPGQKLTLAVALTRREGAPEGEYRLPFSVTSAGRSLGDFELRVDNTVADTPEDQGYIRLGKGSIRPAPSRLQYFAYAAAPALLVGAIFWARRRTRTLRRS